MWCEGERLGRDETRGRARWHSVDPTGLAVSVSRMVNFGALERLPWADVLETRY